MSAVGLRDKARTEINTAISDTVEKMVAPGLSPDDMLRSAGRISGLRDAIAILDANVKDLHAA